MSHKVKIGIVSAITALGVAVAATMLSKGPGRGSLTSKAVADAVDTSALTTVARARVFFGHQSVGGNIIEGIAPAYAAKGLTSPEIIELSPESSPSLPSGGFFAHSLIGVNGEPEGKLDAFDSMLRSGVGDEVNVAMMKFCYLDVTASTDVDALFSRYQDMFAALERDYPDVTFVHLTTPLTTATGFKSRVKSMLGGGNPNAADNAARERFNALVRNAYGEDRLFDLAVLESTAPDGSAVSGSYDGQEYHTLYEGYAIDEGHLTPTSSQLAASELLELVANAPA